jgi:hypothetical protein
MEEPSPAPTGAHNTGNVVGVPSPHIENVGMLDLRTASPEEIGRLRHLKNVGTVLITPELRGALKDIVSENVGAFIEASAEERVLIGPVLDIDAAMLETMSDGQKLIVIGVLSFAADAPPALVSQKFERVRLTGILIAPKAVSGALFGKLEHTGVAISLEKVFGGLVREMGSATITAGYLTFVKPESAYLNIGRTEFAADVPLDLVQSRIVDYYNVGLTVAPQTILDYLRARCSSNLGAFQTPAEAHDGEEGEDDSAGQ